MALPELTYGSRELEHCHGGISNHWQLHVTALVFPYKLSWPLNEPDSALYQHFRQFCEILDDHVFHLPRSRDFP